MVLVRESSGEILGMGHRRASMIVAHRRDSLQTGTKVQKSKDTKAGCCPDHSWRFVAAITKHPQSFRPTSMTGIVFKQ